MPEILYRPDWNLPRGVHAFVTTRQGGQSTAGWSSFNLARHAGDASAAVGANRDLLLQMLRAETAHDVPDVQWVSQVHGTRVFHAGRAALPAPEADAVYAHDSPLAIGVLTADCLPVLFCSNDGHEIGVAHAGWRGLLNGVLEATVASFHAQAAQIRAWLGPAIGPCHFEVGEEVRAAFIAAAPRTQRTATEAAFVAGSNPDKWLADLYALARLRLRGRGLDHVDGEPVCTVCNNDRFYSYRKQPVTGRFATLILREP